MAIEFYNEIDLDKVPKPSEGVDEETKLEVEALKNISTATMLALTDIYESKLETDDNIMLALAEVYELILGGM